MQQPTDYDDHGKPVDDRVAFLFIAIGIVIDIALIVSIVSCVKHCMHP
jgi:hypothetical protein